jgi:hypothetical protein
VWSSPEDGAGLAGLRRPHLPTSRGVARGCSVSGRGLHGPAVPAEARGGSAWGGWEERDPMLAIASSLKSGLAN